MGPVQLNLKNETLYNAWEQSRISEIEDYKGANANQTKKVETWICRPPNILLF